jgi:hypothetical protein
MTTTNNFLAKYGIVLTAKLAKQGVYFPNDNSSDLLHNSFNVYVTTKNGRTSFRFYGSNMDYNNNVTALDESAVLSAFECFVSDAMAGSNSFKDFCSEMGYDTDSRRAYKTFKACEKSNEKFERLFPNVDIYDLHNDLQDADNIVTPESVKADENFNNSLELDSIQVYTIYTGGVKVTYYAFKNGSLLFDGFVNLGAASSPDSLQTCVDILSFLSCQPGDTDPEYFANYTTAQMDWANSYECEQLKGLLMDFEDKASEYHSEAVSRLQVVFNK